MANEKWVPEVIVDNIEASLTPEGEIGDELEVEVSLVERVREEDTVDTVQVAHVTYLFLVDGGRARLHGFKDASPSGSEWSTLDFLKTIEPTKEAVSDLPGIVSVEGVDGVVADSGPRVAV